MAKVYWWAWIGIVLLPHLGRCQTPVIFHSSLTAGVGDIIYLQGSDFGNSPYVQYSYDSSNWKSMPLVTTGQGVISAKIPATESRLPDILTLRVSSDNVNWSAPVFINKPIAFAFDTDVVAPGSSFRIFGRNLLFGRRPYVRFHDLKTNSDQFAAIDVTNSTHYFISAKAPSNIIPAHTYEVFVNNGYDGDSPTPVHTIVQEPIKGIAAGPDYWNLGLPWSSDFNFYGNVYNVKTDARLNNVFATGDGVADDTWAISHAIQVASAAGGGVVYLPDGSYTLHFANGCGITLLPRVVLQGSGKDRVQINYGYPVGTLGGYGVCFANQTGLADVTIQSVDTAEQWQWSGLSVSNTEVFLKRVAWNIGTSQAINFVNDDHVAIEDSTITQGTDDKFNFLGPLNVQGCSRCEISNNSINFSVGGQIFDNASDLVFENNSVTRDISVSPNPATVTHSIAANFVKNLVVMNNTFSSLGDGVATNNDGEVLETEAGGPMRFDEFRGSVSAATATTLTDENQNFFSSSNYVPALRAGLATLAVVNGNGLGQTRLITAVSADGKTLTIDHPWDVQPEQNAHYATFDWSAENWTVAKNQLIGNFKGIELFNASGNNLLIESNTLTDSDGIMISPTENAPGTFNLVTNLDIVGNLLVDQKGLRPAFIDLTPREDLQSASFGTQIIGAAIRGNSVIGFIPNPRITNPSWDDYKIKSEGYLCSYYWQSYGGYDSSNQAPLLGAIFQGNAAWNASSAFSLNSGAVQTSISDSFLLNSGALDDNPLPGAAQGSVNTAFLDSLSLLSIGGAAPIASSNASTDTPFRAVASVNGTRAVQVEQPTGYSMAATGDNIQFLSRQLSGQSDAVVHVSMMPGATGNGMLMMRSSTAQDSAFLGIGLSNGSIVLQTRLTAGGSIESVNFPFDKPDVWLKLQNKGQLINAMYSQDGRTWQTHPNAVLFPGTTYLAGVTELSNGADPGSHVVFDSLTLGTSPGGATGPPVLTGSSGRTHNPFKRALKAAGEVAVALWRAVRSFVIRVV